MLALDQPLVSHRLRPDPRQLPPHKAPIAGGHCFRLVNRPSVQGESTSATVSFRAVLHESRKIVSDALGLGNKPSAAVSGVVRKQRLHRALSLLFHRRPMQVRQRKDRIARTTSRLQLEEQAECKG